MASNRIARSARGAASYSGNASGLAVDSDSDRLQLNLDGTQRFIDARTLVAAGATKTLTAKDSGSIVQLDTAAGSIVTLPASSGSGARFEFVITTIPTSNSHIVKVANATDTMYGLVSVMSDAGNAALIFKASGTDDTITLNRTTTGGTSLGEKLVLTDVASGKWHVTGVTAATGVEVTPFSATV